MTGRIMTEAEIEVRFQDGKKTFADIQATLAEINAKLEVLPQMEADIAAAKESAARASDLIEAWNALKTGGKFVRWIAPVVAAVVSAWLAVKGYFK